MALLGELVDKASWNTPRQRNPDGDPKIRHQNRVQVGRSLLLLANSAGFDVTSRCSLTN